MLSAALLLLTFLPQSAFAAPSWPSDISVSAEGAVLMDANSGCILYEKNPFQPYYPASITKILTALIVIERCDPDDILTFSHDAVHNVESGSTSAGYDEGDQITVREALYAMLLKSANEVANALAEHCAGSISAFAGLMNEKAASLGCTGSSFTNPSGLNDENHYTTPRDFALIAQAAFENPVFTKYDSTTYYELPANSANHESFTVYCGHKMLKKNSGHYYPGIIGGKTGYTLLAGNTLVTCAERNGLKLITVILNGHKTHYADTRALLDFGFQNFKSEAVRGEALSALLRPETDLNLTGSREPLLTIDASRSVTLPKEADFSEVRTELSYELSEKDPPGAVARIRFFFGEHEIGNTWLAAEAAPVTPGASPANRPGSSPLHLLKGFQEKLSENGRFFAVPALLLAAAALLLFLLLRFRSARRRESLRFSERLRRSALEEDELFPAEGLRGGSADYHLPGARPRSRRKMPSRKKFTRRG